MSPLLGYLVLSSGPSASLTICVRTQSHSRHIHIIKIKIKVLRIKHHTSLTINRDNPFCTSIFILISHQKLISLSLNKNMCECMYGYKSTYMLLVG